MESEHGFSVWGGELGRDEAGSSAQDDQGGGPKMSAALVPPNPKEFEST